MLWYVLSKSLKEPLLILPKIGTRAMIPIELCTVTRGQICRKEIPPAIQDRFRDFSTKKPHERLESIQRGIGVRLSSLNFSSANTDEWIACL